jgi:hypothetical protein
MSTTFGVQKPSDILVLLKEALCAIASPFNFKFHLHTLVFSDDAVTLESTLHARFADSASTF